jgi:hypothetical protein
MGPLNALRLWLFIFVERTDASIPLIQAAINFLCQLVSGSHDCQMCSGFGYLQFWCRDGKSPSPPPPTRPHYSTWNLTIRMGDKLQEFGVFAFWYIICDASYYLSNLPNSTLIILCYEMLEFSKIISFKSKNIVKDNSEYLGIYYWLNEFFKSN